jgi:hypothetical protein
MPLMAVEVTGGCQSGFMRNAPARFAPAGRVRFEHNPTTTNYLETDWIRVL